jgi:GPH family glycoside/pentoside/hexuronide:cation symporter
MKTGKLPISVKLGFGVCDIGGNLFFTVIGVLLMNYLTDTVGIGAALAGLIVAIGKIWDAVTDPAAGYLSDRTRTRWGRRRPWIFFGSFPLFISMTIMFINPQLSSQTALFIWGVLAFCFLNTAYTAVNIPYNSLTPEITTDYNERTSLNGFRFGFAVVGTVLGGVVSHIIIAQFADKNTGYAVMGGIFGFVMMATALVTFFSVREPELNPKIMPKSFFKTYFKVFKNRPFVIILAAYTLNIIAITIVMGVAIYYFKYLHNDESLIQTAMALMLITAFFIIPVSVLVSKKIGKRAVYAAGLIIFAVSTSMLFLFGHIYPVKFSLYMMLFTGVGLGFTFAMPWAIVPDAIEYDYLLTGERTEGSFYGMWTFSIKIGQAISMAITGAVFSMVNYIPNVAQSPESLFGIRLLIGPIPAVIFILSAAVLCFYPLNENRYNEILDDIKLMESGLEK